VLALVDTDSRVDHDSWSLHDSATDADTPGASPVSMRRQATPDLFTRTVADVEAPAATLAPLGLIDVTTATAGEPGTTASSAPTASTTAPTTTPRLGALTPRFRAVRAQTREGARFIAAIVAEHRPAETPPPWLRSCVSLAPLRLLVVEDNVAHARFVRTLLEGLDIPVEVHQSGRLAGALDRLAVEQFDAILADMHLPDAQGPSIVARLIEAAPSTPVLVVTALDDEAAASAALALGAHDFLAKERLTPELLAHALRRAAQRAAGQGALRDSALLDPQTGLYNRKGLEVATARCLAFARRQKHPVTIIHLRTHAVSGDDANQLARLVRETVRDADLVGRLAPDRLAIVLPDDRSDPPAFLGRLGARRESGPLASMQIDIEVVRFDPAAPVEAGQLLQIADPDPPPPSSRRRALVVTASIAVRDEVAAALGREWSILHAGGSAPALRMAALEEPHLAIIDFDLADDEATVLTRKLSEQSESSELPLIGTGSPSMDSRHSRRDGLVAFVDRGNLAGDLLDAVHRALR